MSHLETTIDTVSTWMSVNLHWLDQSKTDFLLIGLPKQLSKVSDAALIMPSNVTITPSDSARNLGVIFDLLFTMSDHISSVSKSSFLSIRDLRRIRNTLEFSTAKNYSYISHSYQGRLLQLSLSQPSSLSTWSSSVGSELCRSCCF